MSRIFQALRQSGKAKAGEIPDRPAGSGHPWADLMSSLDSWPSSYERPKSEVGPPASGTLEDHRELEEASAGGNGTQPLAGGGKWWDVVAGLEPRPEIVECVEHVACEPQAEERVVTSGQYQNSAQEVFRVLCQRLRYLREHQPLRTILVTSAVPQEGKTVVAINLAALLAHSSSKVLLVDANLRHPRLPVLGFAAERGLADCLAGQVELLRAVRCLDPLGLYFLPAGRASANPAELLQKPILKELLRQAAAVFDWVILDSPSVSLFADARQLATLIDGVLLVVRQDATPREAVEKCVAVLKAACLLGVVFNASTDSLHDRYDSSRLSRAVESRAAVSSAGRERSKEKQSEP